MSLFDISKSDPMRSAPSPNTNDEVANRLAHGTTQNHNSGEIINADGLKFKERQIIARQDGFNKAAFGFYGAANKFGLKVAKPNIDVLTASDSDLIFNSEQNIFKIVASLTLTLQFTRSSSTFASYVTSTPHGLTYTPAFIAMLSLDPTITAIPPSTKLANFFVFTANVAGVYTPFGQAEVTVDSTNVYFQIDISTLSSGTYTHTAKVYLLQETFA